MSSIAPLRVLVVDDNAGALEVCTAILAAHGCEVLPFLNPIAAIASAASFQPHVLVTDVAMPECLGVELAWKVVEAAPSCRIVFHTGEPRLVQECNLSVALPQFTVLEKPVRVADLIRAVTGNAEPKRLPALGRLRIRSREQGTTQTRPHR